MLLDVNGFGIVGVKKMEREFESAQGEREAFEAFCADFHRGSSLDGEIHSDPSYPALNGEWIYDDWNVQSAWATWQARAALKTVPEGVFVVGYHNRDHETDTPSLGWFPHGRSTPLMTVAQHKVRMAEKDAQIEARAALTTPTVKDSLTVRPSAYAVFAGNGNVICFSTQRDHPSLVKLEKEGKAVVALGPVAPTAATPDVSELAGAPEAEQDGALRITPPSIRGTPPCSADCRLPACRARLNELEVLSAPAAAYGRVPTAYVIKGCGTVTLQYKERPAWADGDPTLTVTPLYEVAGKDVSAMVGALEAVVSYDEFAENDDVALMMRYADMQKKVRAALAAHKNTITP